MMAATAMFGQDSWSDPGIGLPGGSLAATIALIRGSMLDKRYFATNGSLARVSECCLAIKQARSSYISTCPIDTWFNTLPRRSKAMFRQMYIDARECTTATATQDDIDVWQMNQAFGVSIQIQVKLRFALSWPSYNNRQLGFAVWGSWRWISKTKQNTATALVLWGSSRGQTMLI